MAQKPGLNGLGMIILWVHVYPTMIAAQQPALSLIRHSRQPPAEAAACASIRHFTFALAGIPSHASTGPRAIPRQLALQNGNPSVSEALRIECHADDHTEHASKEIRKL